MKGLLNNIILSLCIFSSASFAQNQKLDSLKQLLTNTSAKNISYVLAEISLECKQDEKHSYLEKAISFAEQYNNPKALALAYYSQALYFLENNKYEKADSIAKKDLEIAERTKDSLSISHAYLILGKISYSQSFYPEAIAYLQKSLDSSPRENIPNQHHIKQILAKSYFNIGDYKRAYRTIHDIVKYHEDRNEEKHIAEITNFLGAIANNMNDTAKALKYYHKALYISKQECNFSRIAQIDLGLGTLFQKGNRLDSAKYYLKEGLCYADTANDLNIKAQLCLALAEMASHEKNYPLAISYFQKANEISDLTNSYWDKFFALLGHAMVYNKLGEYKKTFYYLDKSRSILNKLSIPILTIEYYNLLADTYAKTGDYEKAFVTERHFNDLNSQYLKNKFDHDLANLHTQFEIEKQEKKNQRLLAENRFKEREIQHQRFTILIVILFFFTTIIYLFVFIKKKKKIQDMNRMLEEKNRELTEANKRLKDLDKYKEGLTKMIIHDLKNPLNVVLTLTEKELVRESANTMFNLISNLLDISKLEEAKMVLNPKIFWLSTTADIAIKKVILSANLANIKIINNIEKIITVFADEILTERIFINLLSNAIKYSPHNSKIILDAQENHSGFARVTIQDFGKGIPPDQIKQIFEMFVQYKARDTETFRSTGIGLTFCKLAVEAMGGHIGVDSTVGEGSVFWFELPLHTMDSN